MVSMQVFPWSINPSFLFPYHSLHFLFLWPFILHWTILASFTIISNPGIDIISSFFLHHPDNLAMAIVSQILTSDNYPVWRHVMKTAPLAKNKIGIIDGSFKKPNKSLAILDSW